MAYVAACTDAGARKQTNEDSCCIEVAETPLGEVLMAVVCDGVGGLSYGNLASTTVIRSFVDWFERELPSLVDSMLPAGTFGFAMVRSAWEERLQQLNTMIRAYGLRCGASLGTTFTGVIVCGGRYLLAHVGDCRAYLMTHEAFAQVSEDQTAVARRLAAGEITPEEAARMPRNVIWQSVGTGKSLDVAFYEGGLGADGLVAICCDGAYKRAGNEGVRRLFQSLDYCDETALAEACHTLVREDLRLGEKDNLTVLCFSGALGGAPARTEGLEEVAQSLAHAAGAGWQAAIDEDDMPTAVDGAYEVGEDDLPMQVDGAVDASEDDLPTVVDGASGGIEDDLPTVVDAVSAGEDDLSGALSGAAVGNEDDLPTMVDGGQADDYGLPTAAEIPAFDEDDLPTQVELGGPDEDDLPTMVEATVSDEDDLPTQVETPFSDEDDLPTAVESVAFDEDDLPTQVETAFSDDDLPTEIEASSDPDDDLPTMVDDATNYDEDDLPTMVGGAVTSDEDDLPTMVEGSDV